MPKKNYTLSFKQKIVLEAQTCGNLKLTARKHKVQPSQIHRWRINIQEITRLASISPKKLTINKGRKLENANLQKTVYSWILKQREDDLAVSKLNIIHKARSIDASFRSGDQKKLMYWVCDFMKQHHLSVRSVHVRAKSQMQQCSQ